MLTPPEEGVIDVTRLTIPELVDLLPTKRITKQRGKDVEVRRSPVELLVLEELWKRHAQSVHRRLNAAVFASGSTLCPLQEPDRVLFVDEVITKTRDALLRLIVRGDLTAKGGYDDFGMYLWRVTMNKALDLRRERVGVRRQERKLNTTGRVEEGASVQESSLLNPIPVSLDHIKEFAAAPDPSLNPVILDARKVLAAYHDEGPERAASLDLVIKKEVEGRTWEELAAQLPDERSLAARMQSLRRFEEQDKAELLVRLENCRSAG